MAQQAQGTQGQILMQEEVTYKSDPSAQTERVPFVTESLRLSRNLVSSNTIRGTRNPVEPVQGNSDVAGDISFELQGHSDFLFYAALGNIASIAGSDPYTYVITVSNASGATLPSFVIDKGFTDLLQDYYFHYNGCKVNSLSLTMQPEGFQELSTSWIGASEGVNTTSFDGTGTVAPTFKPFDGFVGTIKEGSPTPGTISTNLVMTTDFTVENNLDGSVYVIGGSGERASLPEGIVKVSGTISTIFENIGFYNKAIGMGSAAESGLELTYSKGDGLGSLDNEYCQIYIPELWFAPQAPIIEGPTGVKVDLPFEAFYTNNSDTTSMKVTFKNAEDRATDHGWS